jgi:hypothetical protein
MVRDIVAEKNYEEIYQFYTYYEVSYDVKARVKIFKEYNLHSAETNPKI